MVGKGGRLHFQEELLPVLSLEGQIGISQQKTAVLFSSSSQTPLSRTWPSINLMFDSYSLLSVCAIRTYSFNIQFPEPVRLGKGRWRVFPCQG